jgi:ribosomal protein S14
MAPKRKRAAPKPATPQALAPLHDQLFSLASSLMRTEPGAAEELVALARQAQTLPRPRKSQPTTGMKRCPKCGKQKDIDTAFGLMRKANGAMAPQSYCKACRGKA